MTDRVQPSHPALPPINRAEVLRYMGVKQPDNAILNLLDACIAEAEHCFANRVCWQAFAVHRCEHALDLGFARVESRALCKKLEKCDTVVLFAATVGLEIDRLIAKYSRLSPARALCLQALGAERIEALCDAFEDELHALYPQKCLRPRFSPGYGDLPLELQTDIFCALDCAKRIGLSLNDSLLMSPSKSVTALIGMRNEEF